MRRIWLHLAGLPVSAQINCSWGTSNNHLTWCFNSLLVSLYQFLFNPCKSVPVCRWVGLPKSGIGSSLMKVKATWLIVVAITMAWIQTMLTIDRFFTEAWPRQIVLIRRFLPAQRIIFISRKWKWVKCNCILYNCRQFLRLSCKVKTIQAPRRRRGD